MSEPEDVPTDASIAENEIVVYSRPGCPFCFALRAGLRHASVPFREINIWEDADAAAFVRSVANGNETVPTVTIGDTSMVNPSARTVIQVAAALNADPTPSRRRWTRTRGGRGKPS